MAVPIFRASVPHSRPAITIHSLGPSLPTLHETSKNRRLLFCAPSEHNPVRPTLSFCVGVHLIPHPSKVDRGGEDAFFVSSYKGGALAVADGVSGWAEQNVDPSMFPQELMTNFSDLVEDEEVNSDPQVLIRKAHAATSSIGSATVIVAILERNGILKIANVGDCGLRVIRAGRVVFSSIPQEHYFDCPYQLSSEVISQTYLDAKVSSMELIEGDTIIMGSDGLFDNVFDHEMISTLAQFKDVVEAAKALANLASIHAKDSDFDSPYALEARSRGFDIPWWKKILGRKLTGGKLDDITVIVGQVVSS
uniref:Protein phosphatase n=1 Tax=Cannabis sativa TaxID=3483 RepID=A0A803PV04_CANSA